MTTEELNNIISNISYRDWKLEVVPKNDGHNLQAVLPNGTKSGKWYISPYIAKSEFVQRCFLCITQAEEHERRLDFKYKDTPVFKPHYDVDDLVELSKISQDRRNEKVV